MNFIRFNQSQYTAQLWQLANRDNDNVLSRDELFPLLKSLGYRLSKPSFKSFFNKFDSDSSGNIEFNEFEDILRGIRVKNELKDIYKNYVSRDVA